MKHHIRLNGKALLLALLAFGILGASLAGCSPDIFGKYNNPRDPNNSTTTTTSFFQDNNANLQSLTVGPGSLVPSFSPQIINYRVTLDSGTGSIGINAGAASPMAIVSTNGNFDSLNPGDNSIVVTVTAFSGVTKDYTLTVHRTLAIGSTGPGQGLIFYASPENPFPVNGVQCRYLEVAPASAELSAPGIPWDSANVTVLYTQSDGLGGGYANTQAITNLRGSNSNYAPGYAWSYSAGGFADWYLPNTFELSLVATALSNGTTRLGGFVEAYYWTSRQISANAVDIVNFGNFNSTTADTTISDKTLQRYVRPIRAFY